MPSQTGRRYRICGETFIIPGDTGDVLVHVGTVFIEKAVLVLGPLLICFASVIISGLSHVFFTVILPMMQHKYAKSPYGDLIINAHIGMVIFVLIEIIFNYFMCVTTRNKGPNYDRVAREMAEVTGFNFPETPQEAEKFRRDVEDKLNFRMKKRFQRSSREELPAAGEETAEDVELSPNVKQRKPNPAKKQSAKPSAKPGEVVRPWMLMAHDEWGWCNRSNQPKPPRAHYDHVSKTLVLCLDHYCPWMFNVVGYFNYRYFCNFLWFVEIGMIYGAWITYEPFMHTSGQLYRLQRDYARKAGEQKRIYPMVPFTGERMAVSLGFMMCLSIGIAVACLGLFHLYLCLTGQTTIEFHGNWVNKRKAKRINKKYTSPYDMGWKRNWQQVYGSQNMLTAFLVPSRREPEFLPLPLPGEEGKRKWARSPAKKSVECPMNDEETTDLIV